MRLGGLRALATLCDELQPGAFQRHFSSELRGVLNQVTSLGSIRRDMLEFLSRPEIQARIQNLTRAEAGDWDAVCGFLEEEPFDALQHQEILRHLEARFDSGNEIHRIQLERAATSIRKGLLRPKPGRPRKFLDAERATEQARAIQVLYESAPLKIRRWYSRDEKASVAVSALADHVARPFPEREGARIREAIATLYSKETPQGGLPRYKTTFGVSVVARMNGVSTRTVRSRLKPR